MCTLQPRFFSDAVSQVSTRLITFILNLLTARLLTVDAYGVRPSSASSLQHKHVCMDDKCVHAADCVPVRHETDGSCLPCVQLASVQFHLINTTILFLSREGLRRGCLRAQQIEDASGTKTILGIAALCIPLGAIITLCVCAVALRGSASLSEPYATAILLQGLVYSRD